MGDQEEKKYSKQWIFGILFWFTIIGVASLLIIAVTSGISQRRLSVADRARRS